MAGLSQPGEDLFFYAGVRSPRNPMQTQGTERPCRSLRPFPSPPQGRYAVVLPKIGINRASQRIDCASMYSGCSEYRLAGVIRRNIRHL